MTWNNDIPYLRFFRMYPISALFATIIESRKINRRKFDTKFSSCNTMKRIEVIKVCV